MSFIQKLQKKEQDFIQYRENKHQNLTAKKTNLRNKRGKTNNKHLSMLTEFYPPLLPYVLWYIEHLVPCMKVKHYCKLLHWEETLLRLNHRGSVKFLVENACQHAVRDNGFWFHKAYFILKVSQTTVQMNELNAGEAVTV